MGIKESLRKIKNKLIIEKTQSINIPVIKGNYLEGSLAFISGGSGGIGFAIAERFIDNGCRVIISGTNKEKWERACLKLGENARYIILDVKDVRSFDTAFSDIKNLAVDCRITILVNSAGRHGPSNFWAVTIEDWDQVMDVNLRGMFFLTKLFSTYFRDEGIRGHILNIGSASALKPGKTPYEISKSAVKSMTLGMAAELIKYGIVVNSLCPGPTATNMLAMDENSSLKWPANPTGRVATPEEIANWAVFMVSSMGDYIVGDSFFVFVVLGIICIDK